METLRRHSPVASRPLLCSHFAVLPKSAAHSKLVSWCQHPPSLQTATRCCASAAVVALLRGRRRGTAAACSNAGLSPQRLELVEQLAEAVQELESLRASWEAMPINGPALEGPQLQSRESAVRESLAACEFGNPAETYAVPQVPSKDPIVAAHSAATQALIEVELAQRAWESQYAESLGHHMLNSPHAGAFASRLLSMAVLRVRLFQHDKAYDLLQQAAPILHATQQFAGPEGAAARLWLENLMRDTAMSQVLREPGSMSGVDLSPGSAAESALSELRNLCTRSGYTERAILKLTKAVSIEMFSSDELVEQLEVSLQQTVSGPDVEPSPEMMHLVDLIRVFLLHRVVPLVQICQLLGLECCKLLLQLQAITAVTEQYKLVPCEEAIEFLKTCGPSSGGFLCFANIKLWPVEDLIIATDRQTWPCKGFEPVMYLSDDSWGLIYAAPRSEVESVLDLCTGSGVQGLVALRYYATKATFVDVNPRALDFVRFNAALNRLGQKVAGIHLGNLYEALPQGSGPFDVVLANPPFLPNPQGTGSQCSAKFGDGGDFGEDILEVIIRDAPAVLTAAGRIGAVTYAPNVDDMPARIASYWAAGDGSAEGCDISVFTDEPIPAEKFNPVSSEVERKRYQEGLRQIGVRTMAEAITLLTRTGSNSSEHKARWIPTKRLFQDHAYLRSLQHVSTA